MNCPVCGMKNRGPVIDYAKVVELRAQKLSYQQIADNVGCTAGHVYRIIRKMKSQVVNGPR